MKKLIFAALLLSLASVVKAQTCFETCWEQFGFGFDNLECQMKCPELSKPLDAEIIEDITP